METLTVLLSPLTPPASLRCIHTHTHTHTYFFCDQWRAHMCPVYWMRVNIHSLQQKKNMKGSVSALPWATHTHINPCNGNLHCVSLRNPAVKSAGLLHISVWICACETVRSYARVYAYIKLYFDRLCSLPDFYPEILEQAQSFPRASSLLFSLSPSSVIRRVIWGIWLLMTVPNPHADNW